MLLLLVVWKAVVFTALLMMDWEHRDGPARLDAIENLEEAACLSRAERAIEAMVMLSVAQSIGCAGSDGSRRDQGLRSKADSEIVDVGRHDCYRGSESGALPLAECIRRCGSWVVMHMSRNGRTEVPGSNAPVAQAPGGERGSKFF